MITTIIVYTGSIHHIINVINSGAPPVILSAHKVFFNLYWRFGVKCTACNVQQRADYNKSILHMQECKTDCSSLPRIHLCYYPKTCPARCISFIELRINLFWLTYFLLYKGKCDYFFEKNTPPPPPPPILKKWSKITYPPILA